MKNESNTKQCGHATVKSIFGIEMSSNNVIDAIFSEIEKLRIVANSVKYMETQWAYEELIGWETLIDRMSLNETKLNRILSEICYIRTHLDECFDWESLTSWTVKNF